MKATPLYKHGETVPTVWLCGDCNYGGRVTFDTEAWAEAHCRCDWEGCTERRAEHRCYCAMHDKEADARRAAEREAADLAQFAKAKKITEAEYTGAMVFDPGERGGDGFFSEVCEVVDAYESDGDPPPAYVWATTECHFSTDAQGVIDHELENVNVDSDLFDFDAASLQKVLDAWWEENGRPYYVPDYTTAILVAPVEVTP